MTIIQQRVLSNARLNDDVGIWESSIVYRVLYLVFEAETIVGVMAGFLMEMVIFIEIPGGRYKVRLGCGI